MGTKKGPLVTPLVTVNTMSLHYKLKHTATTAQVRLIHTQAKSFDSQITRFILQKASL